MSYFSLPTTAEDQIQYSYKTTFTDSRCAFLGGTVSVCGIGNQAIIFNILT